MFRNSNNLSEEDNEKPFPFGGGSFDNYIYDGRSTIPVLSETTKLQDSVVSVNDFSTGLKVSMNSPFTENYDSSLELQRGALRLINGNILNSSVVLNATASISGAIADIGLATVNTHKLYDSGLINENQLRISGELSDTLMGIVRGQQTTIRSGIISLKDSSTETLNINNPSLSTAARIVSTGIDSIVKALPTYPSKINFPNLSEIKEISIVGTEELSNHQKELDVILIKINPDLVEYRQGAWRTFKRKDKDYIGQSAGSMRRFVDGLIDKLAPVEKVKKTSYFKLKEKEKNRLPHRIEHLKYIVKFEEKTPDHLKSLVNSLDSLLKAYENLPAWDHAPLKPDKDQFVYGIFLAIEALLISLVSEVKIDEDHTSSSED